MTKSKARRRIGGTVEVDVDIQDVIDQLEDEDTLELADAIRGATPDSRHVAIDVINQIRRGDYADAITTLEREFMPKWTSVDACREAVAKAKS